MDLYQRSRVETVRFVIQAIVSIGISVYFLVVYGLYGKEECDAQLPVFLLVSGITQLVLLILSAILTFAFKPGTFSRTAMSGGSTNNCATCMVGCCLVVVALFFLAWFIVGNVWTFGLTEADCHPLVYYTSFWYIIVVYIMMGIGCIIGIIVACCIRAQIKASTGI